MKCPACKEENLAISERKGIEIDYCPQCRGIWLDRGELDKILERSREEASAPPGSYSQGPQAGYRQDHHHKPYKKKKSFLEELFD